MIKMSTVRINDNIKKLHPILDDLGLSLKWGYKYIFTSSKINNGIPFNLKRRRNIELNDGYGSYICEYGHLHDYSKINFEELEKDTDGKVYNNVEDLIERSRKQIVLCKKWYALHIIFFLFSKKHPNSLVLFLLSLLSEFSLFNIDLFFFLSDFLKTLH